jgi:hypothetical protein
MNIRPRTVNRVIRQEPIGLSIVSKWLGGYENTRTQSPFSVCSGIRLIFWTVEIAIEELFFRRIESYERERIVEVEKRYSYS